MQGQQQEHQPHPSTLTPQKERGEEKGFPRTHRERFFRSIPQPGLFFPPRLQPGEYGNGECGMAVQPPSQVGCDSPRNWAGEPIRPRRGWHKLSQEELGQSTDQRGGASPTRLLAQWGKGLCLSKRKTNLFSLAPSEKRWCGLDRSPP